MATTTHRDATVFYEDVGAGDPPMVLVHGLGGSAHFAAQIEHFRHDHRVVAADLPGFGRSEPPREVRGTMADYADDVGWLCDELDVRAPVIVGHSMGGAIAFELAAARPELPLAIVLLDPLPIVPLPALREQRASLVNGLAGPDYVKALRAFAEARMFRPTDNAEVRARIVDDICAVPQRVLVPTFSSITEWSGEAIASRVRCPVLLITAGDGLPTDMVRTRELVPRLEVARTVGSGHFVHVFSRAQVNAMIDTFLGVSARVCTQS